jgi:hypothetical protein
MQCGGKSAASPPLTRVRAGIIPMKVEGTDILSEVTERTSRNLKVIAATVIAIVYFDVKVKNLRVLNVDLPGELFTVVSFAVIAYLMFVLVAYWLNDYLLWRNGPILAAKATLDRYVHDLVEGFEKHAEARSFDQNVKYLLDQFASAKASALDCQRSVAKTTWLVCFVVFWLHLIIPLSLGFGAFAYLLGIPAILHDPGH